MDLRSTDVRETIIPRLRRARLERLTLTGGEPFVHPDLLQICKDGVEAGLSVGIRTKGTGVTDEQIVELQKLGRVHVNVSFDGLPTIQVERWKTSNIWLDPAVGG